MEIDKDELRLKSLTGVVIRHSGHATKLNGLLSWGDDLGDYKVIYQCLVDMAENRRPISVTSVITAIKSELNILDGSAWKDKIEVCVKLAKSIPSKRIESFINDIGDTLTRKAMKRTANMLSHAADDDHSDVGRLLDTMEEATKKLRHSQGTDEVLEVTSHADQILQDILDTQAGKRKPFINTGYKYMDRMIKGLYNDKLYTVAARTKVGKSAYCTCMSLYMAKQGFKVGYISLEMDKKAMTKRFAQHLSGVDADLLHDGYNDDDFNRITKAMDEVKQLPLWISTPFNNKISTITSMIRRMKYGGCNVVIVDYVQLMTNGNFKSSKEQVVSEASTSLMHLCKELHMPIVQVAQLNRQAVDGPKLHHIRDSDQIALNSHVVILLDRDINKIDHNSGYQDAAAIVAANRDGVMGKAKMSFFGKAIRYTDHVISTTMTDKMEDNDDL